MATLVQYPLLVVVACYAAALVGALLPRGSRVLSPLLAALGPVLVSVLAAASLSRVAFTDSGGELWRSELASQGAVEWFRVGDAVLSMGWAVDSLAAIMLGVVGVVALCVVVFSVGYMAGDAGWNRYFALLSVFTGSMTLLVVADSFSTLFIGWELVGACSYLLIGFWYRKPSAAAAATKAFLTTRVGDVGLLLGMGLLWWILGTLSYEDVVTMLPTMPPSVLSLAALLIAVGAIGKSAQFPLHAWLPDAMEGPTPVSALIHAATMVAAGVYLIVRVWPVFEAAPGVLTLLLVVGSVSALGAALAAAPQCDIKKVLAYSTISQLGFMFAALGVGAWQAAFFHLVTHAGFKALLFLGSGSVIHGAGTQELHEMGGLRRKMPVTFATWVIGVLALAGVPGLAGFFSKDAVLESVWHHAPLAGIALFAASAVTAFYAARATRLAFFGELPSATHPHESPISMLIPLGVLALPSLAAGWMATRLFEVLAVEAEPLALGISVAAVAAAAVGGAVGWRVARTRRTDMVFATRLGAPWRFLRAGYRYDHAVDSLIVRPTLAASRALWAWGDRLLVDGAVEGLGWITRSIGTRVAALHAGDAQAYAAVLGVGAMLMLLAAILAGR